MRFLWWIIFLPVALIVIIFAGSNRHDVLVDLWPFPWRLDLPMYLAVLLPLLAVLVIGLVTAGIHGIGLRKEARANRRRAESLERQLAAAQRERDEAQGQVAAAAATNRAQEILPPPSATQA